MSHTCHARGCETCVPPQMLMCRTHWFKIPRNVQVAVYLFYVPGQCNLDPKPSKEWHEAASAAIGYVAKLEGQKFSVNEARAMAAYGVLGKTDTEKLQALTAGKKKSSAG